LSSVCGIKPANIGFNTVKITPHLGELKSVKASMPYLNGRISVDCKMVKGKFSATIELPEVMNGISI